MFGEYKLSSDVLSSVDEEKGIVSIIRVDDDDQLFQVDGALAEIMMCLKDEVLNFDEAFKHVAESYSDEHHEALSTGISDLIAQLKRHNIIE